MAPNTPLPTPWPKDEYEAYTRAHQAKRAQMRAADAPEADMNELFREALAFNAELFSNARHRDAIGAFRGANYDANAYYRSEMNCLMFTRVEHFCRVCSGAIEAVIDEYSRAPE